MVVSQPFVKDDELTDMKVINKVTVLCCKAAGRFTPAPIFLSFSFFFFSSLSCCRYFSLSSLCLNTNIGTDPLHAVISGLTQQAMALMSFSWFCSTTFSMLL